MCRGNRYGDSNYSPRPLGKSFSPKRFDGKFYTLERDGSHSYFLALRLATKMQRRSVDFRLNNQGCHLYAEFSTRYFVRVFAPADHLSDHAEAPFRTAGSLRHVPQLRKRIRLQLGRNATGGGAGRSSNCSFTERHHSTRTGVISSLAARRLNQEATPLPFHGESE